MYSLGENAMTRWQMTERVLTMVEQRLKSLVFEQLIMGPPL